MTPESNLITSVKKGFKQQRILMQRLEVVSGVGVPDCSYSMSDLPGAGFIEFKRLREWPKRNETPVRIDHFTNEQRGWMMLHGPYIQRVFLHLQVSKTHMLFPWTAIKDIGKLNRVDLIHLAECTGGSWMPHVNYTEYDELIRRNYVTQKTRFNK